MAQDDQSDQSQPEQMQSLSPDPSLQPPQRQPQGPQQMQSPIAQLAQRAMAAHNQIKQKYDQLKKSRTMLDKVRKQMDELTQKADTVTPDDVIKSASTLVSEGMGAQNVAGILADMPQNPRSLQAWVAMHDQGVIKQELVVNEMLTQMRHQLGVAALHAIIADHVRTMGTGPRRGAPPTQMMHGGPQVGPQGMTQPAAPSTPGPLGMMQ